MTSDDAAPALGARLPQRGYVRFSAKVAREICWRTAAGETQAEICADPHMPSVLTIYRWSKRRAGFARAYARARAMGAAAVRTRSTFCPVTANEIVARISEGEMLSTITADPHLPCLATIRRWAGTHPEFAEEMRLAREALAERLGDLGWKMAMEATPQTAYLTWVRLGQLRWTAAVLGPRTHGKLKATEPPAPPQVEKICYRHFEIEVHPETGQRRVAAWRPDPDTMRPVREPAGPWLDPVDPVEPGKGVDVLIDARKASDASDDPEGWC